MHVPALSRPFRSSKNELIRATTGWKNGRQIPRNRRFKAVLQRGSPGLFLREGLNIVCKFPLENEIDSSVIVVTKAGGEGYEHRW